MENLEEKLSEVNYFKSRFSVSRFPQKFLERKSYVNFMDEQKISANFPHSYITPLLSSCY